MKTLAVVLPMLGLAAIGYGGQTNEINLPRTTPSPPPLTNGLAGSFEASGTNVISQRARAEKSYGGALPELRKRKMQILKTAPEDRNAAGFEKAVFENVSVNPITGRPEGIILLSIKF